MGDKTQLDRICELEDKYEKLLKRIDRLEGVEILPPEPVIKVKKSNKRVFTEEEIARGFYFKMERGRRIKVKI